MARPMDRQRLQRLCLLAALALLGLEAALLALLHLLPEPDPAQIPGQVPVSVTGSLAQDQ